MQKLKIRIQTAIKVVNFHCYFIKVFHKINSNLFILIFGKLAEIQRYIFNLGVLEMFYGKLL